MSKPSINEVRRVLEIGTDVWIHGLDVNGYLDEGWLLLHVYSISVASDHGPSQRAVYVLGWTSEEDPPSDTVAAEQSGFQESIQRMRDRMQNPDSDPDATGRNKQDPPLPGAGLRVVQCRGSGPTSGGDHTSRVRRHQRAHPTGENCKFPCGPADEML